MTKLCELVTVSDDERPFIDFESSLDNDHVVAGYVPVKSTMDVLTFLNQAAASHTPQGRAVICFGQYGTGKSRLCAVLARFFRDGFESPALLPIWQRLHRRGETATLESLRKGLRPGGGAWHPWLVVTVYAQGGGGTLSATLIRALFKAIRRAGLDADILGHTIYHTAACRLEQMIKSGAAYVAAPASSFATAEQLQRALGQDLDDTALEEFRAFHREATHGVEFEDFLHGSGATAMEAPDVYIVVAERIQSFGYDGIVVIWDEFGFAIEQLLRGGRRGIGNLGVETMKLQSFLERTCGSQELGKRVVFLGFTHVSIPEYGTRERLNEADQNRLDTVSGRFRDPPIAIRLSVTETEGYHLLGGMIQRTAHGESIFSNPIPRLQQLADRMPKYPSWQRFSAQDCYNEIVAPCYPLHPATGTALLMLSDQIAQVNRTTFYYLQNRDEGGLAEILSQREIPEREGIGGAEMARVHDLFAFFEGAIKAHKRDLYGQYEEALARFPGADPLEVSIVRTILILSAIATSEMAPTTNFLSFCHCDVTRDESAAQPLHAALQRLSAANAVWMNQATDVWGFVGERGLGTEVDRLVDEELELVPEAAPALLLRRFPQVQDEIADRLGDFDLDPNDAGIVRRIGVRVSDIARTSEAVNPARDNPGEDWRSAMIYLVAVDTSAQLDFWRQRVSELDEPSLYFAFPREEVHLDGRSLRELIAVMRALEKVPADGHAHEVLESKYTRLRTELREQFEQAFGNEGLRSGTLIVPAGRPDAPVAVDSWNRLLPAVAEHLESRFPDQIRIRCGSFNEWKSGPIGGVISKVVQRILKFDDSGDYRAEYLGFKRTSQEAAIVDGVLVENRLLTLDPLEETWHLAPADNDCPLEALRTVSRHFRTAGIREFDKLFGKLIDPPFGIPNGIIPMLVALAFRTDGPRIALYRGNQNQRVTDAELARALVDMAKHPSSYRTRYTKLTGKQRTVFKAVGPLVGVEFRDRFATGEAFYGYCEQVRGKLKDWVVSVPEAALKIAELSEPQRQFLRLLRGPVPPQLPVLADHLIAIMQEVTSTHVELVDTAAGQSYPQMERVWRALRGKIDRYLEGVKAPVREAIRTALEIKPGGREGEDMRELSNVIRSAGEMVGETENSLCQVAQRLAEQSSEDIVISLATAVSGKAASALTDEDFGRAAGMMEVTSALAKQQAEHASRGQYLIVLPNGQRRTIVGPVEHEPDGSIIAELADWRKRFSLTDDDAAFFALSMLFPVDVDARQEVVPAGDGDADELAEGADE
jgi:hypothetical protein